MWSLNRDRPCGSWFPQSGLLSNTCSGTAQSGLEFSQVFGRLHGTTAVTSSAGNVQAAVANTNPADAPYPQWSATASYPSRYKVVENGEIYQATWFNSGDDPQAQVQYSWQTPWELLGPVLPGDHAPVGPRLPASTYPQWSITASYKAGDKVYFQTCRTCPNGTTRGCRRKPSRVARLTRHGRRCTRSPASPRAPDPRPERERGLTGPCRVTATPATRAARSRTASRSRREPGRRPERRLPGSEGS